MRGLSQVPALLCGRLAVDHRLRGLGSGTVLVELLLSKAVEFNRSAACRAVIVNALDAEARAWWERFGFVPFNDDEDERDLYLLTKDIERTLRALAHRRSARSLRQVSPAPRAHDSRRMA